MNLAPLVPALYLLFTFEADSLAQSTGFIRRVRGFDGDGLHVVHLTQHDCGCGASASAWRAKPTICSGATLTPPTPAR